MFLKCVMFLLFIYFQRQIQTQDYDTAETLGINDRINLLKRQLLKQIRNNKQNYVEKFFDHDPANRDRSIGDDYQYVDTKNRPITPIMDNDQRKLKGRWKHKPMMTKKPKTTTSVATSSYTVKPMVSETTKKKRVLTNNIPSEIFYRRWEGMDKSRNTPLKYTHCLDLLTAYLMYGGDKGNKTSKVVGPTDTVVLRLLHLLAVDVRHDSQEEIYSILYQISSLKLRLFQWDDKAITLLLNQIIRDKNHSFQTLKHGVKEMFHSWHLDLGNASNLLEQSRIFRPPCIQTSEFSGSTKTSRAPLGAYYTKSSAPKKICTGLELEDDSCEI